MGVWSDLFVALYRCKKIDDYKPERYTRSIEIR
jgi:hypothetical protein